MLYPSVVAYVVLVASRLSEACREAGACLLGLIVSNIPTHKRPQREGFDRPEHVYTSPLRPIVPSQRIARNHTLQIYLL